MASPLGGAYTPGFSQSVFPCWEAAGKVPTPCWVLAGHPKCSRQGLGPHSPVKGILVGVGHVHDVNEATISCREWLGRGGEGATQQDWGAWAGPGPCEAWASTEAPQEPLLSSHRPTCHSPHSPAEPATMALSFLLCLERSRKTGAGEGGGVWAGTSGSCRPSYLSQEQGWPASFRAGGSEALTRSCSTSS